MTVLLKPDLMGSYSESEKRIIIDIAIALKNRDCLVGPNLAPPRDYMFLYTKSAEAIFSISKGLASTAPSTIHRGVGDWVKMLTGLRVPSALSHEFAPQTIDANKGDSDVHLESPR